MAIPLSTHVYRKFTWRVGACGKLVMLPRRFAGRACLSCPYENPLQFLVPELNHHHRELLESINGLSEILRDSSEAKDFSRYEEARSELFVVRIALVEERLANLKLLLFAYGAALSVLAGTIAILARP